MRRHLSSGLEGQVPTASQPVVMIRLTLDDFLLRVPLINGGPKDYTEFYVKNKHVNGNLFNLAGMSTYRNGVRRVQASYADADSSVYEYAYVAGLMTDTFNGTNWKLYGNDHGNTVSTALAIKMDAGADLSSIPAGTPVRGSSLQILQNFTVYLPKIGVPPAIGATVFGTIVDTHTFDINGCTSEHSHTPTLLNAGLTNAYSLMFPFTGFNRGQFGENGTVFDVTPDNSGQGPNFGQQVVFKGWHTDEPDLIGRAILVNGTPGSPDGWSNVLTSSTFVERNVRGSKTYFNYRSKDAGIVAVASTHKSRWNMSIN